MSAQKEVKKLIKEVEKRGWTADPTSDGYQLKHPDGEHMVTIHKTPNQIGLRTYRRLIQKAEREAEAGE